MAKVLVIDDEMVVARSIKQLIELKYQVQVDVASTVSEAKEYFKQNPYDVLVVDYHLPDGTGYSLVCEQVKEHTWIHDACLVFMSGVSYVDMTPEFKQVTETFKNVNVRNKPVNATDIYEILDGHLNPPQE